MQNGGNINIDTHSFLDMCSLLVVACRLYSDILCTDRLNLGKHFVQDDLLKSVAPIRRELDRVGASSYATNVRWLKLPC